MIEEDLNNIINDDVINYQHKDLQLIINDENIFLNPYGLLNDQHMAIAMQIVISSKTKNVRIPTTHIPNYRNRI